MSKGLVIKRPPESDWERRVKMVRSFPDTMTSIYVYERLALDSKNSKDKKIASRVMRAAGFVVRRGRRWAIWEKPVEVKSARVEAENTVRPSLSLPLPHHIDSVTVTPEPTT